MNNESVSLEEFRPSPGSHIYSAALEAIAKANEVGNPVVLVFNDVRLEAKPGMNAAILADLYMLECHEQSSRSYKNKIEALTTQLSVVLAERAAEHSHIHALAWALAGDDKLTLPEMVEAAKALTTQLEEAKGKLAIATETLATIKYHEERLVDAHIRDYQQEPERREIMLNDRYYYKLVCKALSPDIQRYREEIEREAREKAIKDCIALLEQYGGYVAIVVGISDLKDLLRNQKEVSDES